MSLSNYICIFILLFISSQVTAQEIPEVIHFGRQDYQTSKQNWMITQDCEGYLYVANTSGILIYNAFEWKKVSLPFNRSPKAVFIGKDCRMYCAGYELFGYIDHSNRSNPQFFSLADSILSGTNEEIWNIIGDSSQILFQSFSSVYQYDYQGIQQLSPPSNIMLGASVNGKQYFPKIGSGLYQVLEGTFEDISFSPKLPDKSRIATFVSSQNETGIILGTKYHGLFRLQDNTSTPLESALNERLKEDQINKIIRLQNGMYAIGTILNGIYISTDLLSIKYHLNKKNGLSNNTVLSFFEDDHRNLWVGLDSGIDLVRLGERTTYFYDKQGQLGKIFTSIEVNETRYIGSNHGVFKQGPDGYELLENSQGQTWFFLRVEDDVLCGNNNGTYLIKDDQLVQFSEITGGWWMKQISEDRVLQSTYTGLILLNKSSNQWSVESRIKNGNVLVEKFVLYNHTLLGYHIRYGLCVLKLSSDFKEVTSKVFINNIDEKSISQDVNLFVHDQTFYVYFDRKLYALSNDEIVWIPQNKLDSLKQDPFFASRIELYSNLDMMLEKGQLNRVTQEEHAKSKNRLIGLDEGYILVPTDTLYEHQSHLEHISIDYILSNGKLKEHDQTSILKFRSHEKDLVIQLKSNVFNSIKEPIFYQLTSWGNTWREMGKNGKLTFRNRDDGTHKLIIKNRNGVTRSLLEMSVAPHWYESWPGIFLYIFTTCILIWLVNKKNKKKLIRETERLQEEKKKELNSERMKAKNEELNNELLYKSKMLANSTMALVQKNKMLSELKNNINNLGSDNADINHIRQKLQHQIDLNLNSDADWDIFEENFERVHEDFLKKLKQLSPLLSAGEIRLAAYIRMNLLSKEIAPLMHISIRSVENKRYRLRKKLGLPSNESLSDYFMRL